MRCKVPQCTYNKEEDNTSTSVMEAHFRLLSFHMDAIHPRPPLTAHQQTPIHPIKVKTADTKLQLKDGFVSEEQRNFFTYRWQQYKSAANMDGSEKNRLGACLGACLGDTVATKIFAKLGKRSTRSLWRWR